MVQRNEQAYLGVNRFILGFMMHQAVETSQFSFADHQIPEPAGITDDSYTSNHL